MAKKLTKLKTKKILSDGKIGGKALTAKQKRFLGFIAGNGVATKVGKKRKKK